MCIEYLVAIVVDLADVADIESGILETEVKSADTSEEGVHFRSAV